MNCQTANAVPAQTKCLFITKVESGLSHFYHVFYTSGELPATIFQGFPEKTQPPADKRIVSSNLFPTCLLALFTAINPVLLPAATNSWTRLQHGNLTVYTQSTPQEAGSVLIALGQLRQALDQVAPFRANTTASLRIIVFDSKVEFDQFRPNSASCAFYQQTPHGDYIALQNLRIERKEIYSHEFTHFLLAHSDVTVPLWLNEGMADFYSTFQVSDHRVVFGDSVPGRLPILRSSSWLPLQSLFDVSVSSSYYSDPQRMLLFYSESWALAHMLIASPDYGGRFKQFLNALSDGRGTSHALQATYNKTPLQIEQDLHAYIDQQHLPLIEAALPPDHSEEHTSTGQVSTSEMDIALADLALSSPNTRGALETRLVNASAALPSHAEAEESLGFLALRNGNLADARQHFRAAVDRHSSDPTVLFYLAHLDHEAGAPAVQVIQLLHRSLAVKPDLDDAWLELALVETENGNFSEGLAALGNLKKTRPENAYAAAYAAAYCYAHLDKFPEARQAAHHAQLLAASQRDRAELVELLDYISQQSDPSLISSN